MTANQRRKEDKIKFTWRFYAALIVIALALGYLDPYYFVNGH